VWGSAANDVFAVGNSRTILHYDGNSWKAMDSASANDLRGVWGSSAGDVFAVGNSGTILHYDGSAWDEMDSGSTNDLCGVWGSSANDVFAVGHSGTSLHYDGNSWKAMDSASSNDLRGIWGSSAGDVFAVGTAGTILHYDGRTWTEMNSDGSEGFQAVWGGSAIDVFAVGNHTTYHYDGNAWEDISSETGAFTNTQGVWSSIGGGTFIVGDSGAILHQEPVSVVNLVTKYYNDILDRTPDESGKDAWVAEIDRIFSMGIDVKEGFIALAKFFFNSDEFLIQNKSNVQYTTDLYEALLNREPDAAGFDFWVDQLNRGLSRNVLLNYFVYSEEFSLYMASIFGSAAGNPENNLVNDLYRGLQGRLPDTLGYNGWVELMRNAMSTGEQAVRELSHRIVLEFLESDEYILRNTSDREFLEDLYNGILRRGAQKEEFDGWIENINAGMSRKDVVQQFTNSDEFQLRVQAIIGRLLDANCHTTPQPDLFCITLYDPVCGCDGKTYGNCCEALREGVDSPIQANVKT
ncbi:MAG: DUF4214 domain-containing protein, partial [Desulfobacterales bacterium]